MSLIFGFDMGTTSIGFAVIKHDRQARTGSIKRMGVRIFPEARDPKTKVPLNQERRAKRMRRRQLRRRKERRAEVFRILNEAGLLPPRESEEWNELMRTHKKGRDPYDPYSLRSRAVDPDHSLTSFEVGRALYHISGRRHFLASGIDDSDEVDGQEDADEKQARTNREETLSDLRRSGLTLGQWLSKRDKHERKRGIHAIRQKVEEEFDQIIEAQSQHHPMLGDAEFRASLRNAVFFQRPVFWRKNTLGLCRLLPDEPLCPKGSWLSHQRRMLEKLNNLEIAGGNRRPLDREEREAILLQIQSKASMTWGGVRKALAPLYKQRGEPGLQRNLKFNLEIGQERALLGNPLEAKLSNIFSEDWHNHPHKEAIRAAVQSKLWNADYNERGQRVEILPKAERIVAKENVSKDLQREFSLSEPQAGKLSRIKLTSGWEPYSTKALELILPHLERGEKFGTIISGQQYESWREKQFPKREQPTGEVLDRIPSPADRTEQGRLNNLRNPTVIRVQNELRKVVNNLIGLYGKPDLIRVELARDVGISRRERDERQAGMKRQEDRREKARKNLEENGLEANRRNVDKWMLWEECGKQCPYTGQMISFDGLFRTGQFEVEHIWPRHKSGDNSFINKSLCLKGENQRKNDRIPKEYLGPDQLSALQTRLDNCMRSRANPNGMTQGKIRRFLADQIPDDFSSRQLVDTGYAARETIASLKRLWPDAGATAPVRVQAVSGRITAELRRLWGLNNVLSLDGKKTREDHRHHAVDALVVACTHPGITSTLANYWKQKDSGSGDARVPPPWDQLTSDAKAKTEKVVVSHRVRRKVSGPLHKDTVHGDTGEEESGAKNKAYVTRKSLEELTSRNFQDGDGKIRDRKLRERLGSLVDYHGGTAKKVFGPSRYPSRGRDGVAIRSVRILKKRQSDLMKKATTGYAELGENHHMAIWRRRDGTIGFELVSLAKAAMRKATREPIIERNHPDAERFLMSLSKRDALRVRGSIYIVESIWSGGQVVLVEHNDAREKPKRTRPTPSSLIAQGAQKISVDPIGRIRLAGD